MRELAVHGMPRRYVHSELGYNSRLDAIQAAILNVKLSKLSEWINKRRHIACRYQASFNDLSGIELPSASTASPMSHAWNQFVIRVIDASSQASFANTKEEQDNEAFALSSTAISKRDVLKDKLESHGVKTIIYYPIPIHLQAAYDHLGYKKGSLPITEQLCEEVLSLPMFPELSVDEQLYVVNTLREIMVDFMQYEEEVIATN